MSVHPGEIRSHFPILQETAYLQWPYRAALPTPVRDAIDQALQQHESEGAYARERWFDEYVSAAGEIAAYLGANLDDMTWVPNTTHGLSMIANGIDWQPGDEIIIPADEFPANVYPWMQLEHKGVSVREIPFNSEGRLPAQDLLASVADKTRLLAFSHVSFHNGYRFNIAEIAQGCRERGVICVVDAAQSVGWHALDFNALGCDALVGVGRKFLGALDGLGFCFMRPEFHRQLHVSVPGPFSVKHDRDYLRHELDLRNDAWKFTGGAIPTPQAFALRAAIAMHRSVGTEVIQERALALGRRLRSMLVDAGVPFDGRDWSDEEHSAVLRIRSSHPDLHQRLQTARVSATIRGNAIRVGTHAWNDEADLERLVACLAD